MPYSDEERRRRAKAEQARRRRSRGAAARVGPVGPDAPADAAARAEPAQSDAVGPELVGPGVGPGTSAALLGVILDELGRVRAEQADPLARGRVVAQLVGVALHATKVAELEARIRELTEQAARLETVHHRPGPRRLA